MDYEETWEEGYIEYGEDYKIHLVMLWQRLYQNHGSGAKEAVE